MAVLEDPLAFSLGSCFFCYLAKVAIHHGSDILLALIRLYLAWGAEYCANEYSALAIESRDSFFLFREAVPHYIPASRERFDCLMASKKSNDAPLERFLKYSMKVRRGKD